MKDYDFRVGDFVQTKSGQVGYISFICTCEECEKRGFYEPTIKWLDGTEEYISNYDVKNLWNVYDRIGEYTAKDEQMSIEQAIEEIQIPQGDGYMEDDYIKAREIAVKCMRKQLKIKELIEKFSNKQELMYYKTDASGVETILKDLYVETD